MDDTEQLKIQINTFVWQHAPEEMPLREAEKMAIAILTLFMNARTRFNEQESE